MRKKPKPEELARLDTTCAMCGKQFIRQPGSIYKLIFVNKTNHFCCYTCYLKALEVKENTNEMSYKKLE